MASRVGLSILIKYVATQEHLNLLLLHSYNSIFKELIKCLVHFFRQIKLAKH